MEKGQTVLWIMVGVLIIAGIAGGAYYLGRQASSRPSPPSVASPASQSEQTPQPTPAPAQNETANWKIYTNTQYKFSLKAPFEIIESSRGPGVLESDDGFYLAYGVVNVEDAKKDAQKWTSIRGFPPQTAKSLRALIVKFMAAEDSKDILLGYEKFGVFVSCLESDSCPKVENYQFSTVGNYMAMQYSYEFKDLEGRSNTEEHFSIIAKGMIYKFWTSGETNTFQKTKNNFENIVKTFNLIE